MKLYSVKWNEVYLDLFAINFKISTVQGHGSF